MGQWESYQETELTMETTKKVNRPKAIPLDDLFADIEQGSVWEGFSHILEIANCLPADHTSNRGEK